MAVLGLKSGGSHGLSSALFEIVCKSFTLSKWFMLRRRPLPQTCTWSCTGLHVQSPGGALSRARLANLYIVHSVREVVQL